MPSTTTCAANLRSTFATPASVVATDPNIEVARPNAAADLRNESAVTFDDSPMPITTVTAPRSAAITDVCPTLPEKPTASSALRDNETSLGIAPSVDTAMPIALTSAGVLLATSKLIDMLSPCVYLF